VDEVVVVVVLAVVLDLVLVEMFQEKEELVLELTSQEHLEQHQHLDGDIMVELTQHKIKIEVLAAVALVVLVKEDHQLQDTITVLMVDWVCNSHLHSAIQTL
jgi:hypothetical protein